MEGKKKKLFPFINIFDFRRGERLVEAEQIKGETAYISSTKKNNGISGYITPPDKMTLYKNKITLSNSGSVGYCFYHDYEFVASDHVTVICLKDENIELTSNIALYLKPILESMRYKYNFGREISDERLEKENVLLPVDKNGNPDWSYMELYINSQFDKIKFTSIRSKNKKQNVLNIKRWNEFDFEGENGVFTEIIRGKRLIEANRIAGDIPYYSASGKNNGLTDMISNPLFIERDALIYTTFGDCYYVEGEFTASDEISILKNPKLNIFSGLFIATVLNQSKYKYQFGRKAFYNRLKNETIILPANEKREIDWNYMENFIKSLPYSDKINK